MRVLLILVFSLLTGCTVAVSPPSEPPITPIPTVPTQPVDPTPPANTGEVTAAEFFASLSKNNWKSCYTGPCTAIDYVFGSPFGFTADYGDGFFNDASMQCELLIGRPVYWCSYTEYGSSGEVEVTFSRRADGKLQAIAHFIGADWIWTEP